MKILFLICYLFISNSGTKAKTDFSNHPIQPDTSRYAILKLNGVPDYIFDKNYKTAELSADEINKIEVVIGRRVRKYNKSAKYLFIKNLTNYYQQFIAVTNTNGEKEVWVNCFCEVFPENFNWKKHILSVLDGGSCFFQMKINLTTKRVYDFSVNGVA